MYPKRSRTCVIQQRKYQIQISVVLFTFQNMEKNALKVRSIEEQTHGDTTDKTGNGDGHDPGEEQETHSLPVDGLVGTVAKTDTNGGTSDAHRCRDGKLVLREDEDGDGGTHLHGGTSRRRVVGDFVTHD